MFYHKKQVTTIVYLFISTLKGVYLVAESNMHVHAALQNVEAVKPQNTSGISFHDTAGGIHPVCVHCIYISYVYPAKTRH